MVLELKKHDMVPLFTRSRLQEIKEGLAFEWKTGDKEGLWEGMEGVIHARPGGLVDIALVHDINLVRFCSWRARFEPSWPLCFTLCSRCADGHEVIDGSL